MKRIINEIFDWIDEVVDVTAKDETCSDHKRYILVPPTAREYLMPNGTQ